MKGTQVFSMSFVGAGLLFLGACASTTPTAETTPTIETTPITIAPPVASPATSADKPGAAMGKAGKGGQVVEVGPYHLELVPESEGDTTHLDLYVQKGDTHEAIADAKVAAQIQLPDGTQKTVDFTYAADEKHYTAKLEGSPAGEYKIAVLSDIGGEKVNGRFTYTK